jgi:diazepam-binding inhibitor (GABA receptor modulator, acyl-CoA-binding protein)
MSELDDRFTAAADASKTLPSRPDNDTLLKMYALYKQGTVGDVEGKKPGFTDPVGKAKYQAWEQIKGMSADDAKAAYADLVEGLLG